MEALEYVIPAGQPRRRADKALALAFPEHSRTAIQRAFAAGLVRRGGHGIAQSDSVAPGDRLEYAWPEVEPSPLEPNPIKLDVLFEDRHFLAVNKPAGMVVHPGAATGSDTLVHALLAHCRGNLSGIGGEERPGIVHRLDRETSGVILVAKSDAAHRSLAAQFAAREVAKEYLALVGGSPGLLRGSIRKPIARNPRQRHKMTATNEGGRGREAWTDWEVVERFGSRAALLRCRLHTGRTHQIRVHLKSIGHGILGDRLYGPKRTPEAAIEFPRTMLHAERIAFRHPINGKALDLRAPLPKDFRRAMKSLAPGPTAGRPPRS